MMFCFHNVNYDKTEFEGLVHINSNKSKTRRSGSVLSMAYTWMDFSTNCCNLWWFGLGNKESQNKFQFYNNGQVQLYKNHFQLKVSPRHIKTIVNKAEARIAE